MAQEATRRAHGCSLFCVRFLPFPRPRKLTSTPSLVLVGVGGDGDGGDGVGDDPTQHSMLEGPAQ